MQKSLEKKQFTLRCYNNSFGNTQAIWCVSVSDKNLGSQAWSYSGNRWWQWSRGGADVEIDCDSLELNTVLSREGKPGGETASGGVVR